MKGKKDQDRINGFVMPAYEVAKKPVEDMLLELISTHKDSFKSYSLESNSHEIKLVIKKVSSEVKI